MRQKHPETTIQLVGQVNLKKLLIGRPPFDTVVVGSFMDFLVTLSVVLRGFECGSFGGY